MSRIRKGLLAVAVGLMALTIALGVQGAERAASAAQVAQAAKAKKAPPKRTRTYCLSRRHRGERVCVIQRRCWHKASTKRYRGPAKTRKAKRDAARRKCVRQPRKPAPPVAPGPIPPVVPQPDPGSPLAPGDGRYCAEMPGSLGPGAQCIWYTRNGPWNTPIADGSYARTTLPTQTPTGPITSAPDMYAYPIYYVGGSTPKVDVRIGGVFGVAGDNDTTISYLPRTTVQVPLKPEFVASAGSDGSLIVVDTDTGTEYGFWKLSNSGGWSATNGSIYNIRWDGSPGDGDDRAFTSRGAGLPYGAGIVKAWEVKQGRIDHALAMALGGTVKAGTTHVFPATKSDGTGGAGGVPEGTRYQLDPSINVDTICGSSPVGKMMARAMQKYGVYVVDNSGRTKIFVEGNPSANWGSMLTADTASCIPVGSLKRVS